MDACTIPDILTDLQSWYAAQCDGGWEHQYGVKIDTLGNPGWSVNIDLRDTSLNGRPFPPIAEGIDADREPQSPRSLVCRVEGGIWRGFGDETKLAVLLQTFVDWAREPA